MSYIHCNFINLYKKKRKDIFYANDKITSKYIKKIEMNSAEAYIGE